MSTRRCSPSRFGTARTTWRACAPSSSSARPASAGASRLRGLRLLFAALWVELSGCAALPWPSPRLPAAPAAPEAGLLDLRGVVHVHTEGSHDSLGTLEELLAAARHAGVRWVAITEHPDPGTLPEVGEREGVLLLPGYELNALGGTLLAIGVRARPPRLRPPELVRWIHGQGGVAFVSHLERSGLAQPEVHAEAAPDGIEIANLHAAALEQRVFLALRLLVLPARMALRGLMRLPEGNLARWAALPDAHAIVGGVDAHAKFRLLGSLGGTLDRYRDTFVLLTTHVLAREASAGAILEALRAGRTYIAFEGRAPVDRFTFRARGDGFELAAPRECRLALVCDGREADFREDVSSARLRPPPGAAFCHAEARLGGRPWILSSDLPTAPGPAETPR